MTYRIAVENRDARLREFKELRGDFNGGFRASIPALSRAQVALTRAENEITPTVHEGILLQAAGKRAKLLKWLMS